LVAAITQLETQMREAAKKFEFERAAALRDKIRVLKQRDLGPLFDAPTTPAAEKQA
ncbi:MAG: UvrB/UvrC motif-containing protein, partial [Candidatus Acidiferrales bacterium]